MVYASEAEFQKRMTLTELTVGRHVMPDPPANATHVEVPRAELVRARGGFGVVARARVGPVLALGLLLAFVVGHD